MQEKGILCAKLVVAVEFVQEKDVLCTKASHRQQKKSALTYEAPSSVYSYK